MLRKLLKYEFKSTSRIFSILYLTIFVLSIIAGFIVRNSNNNTEFSSIFVTIIWMLYTIAFIAISAFAFAIILYRFHHNLIRNEGYLMHTLPLPSRMLIASKLIAAFLWSILAIIVSLVSVSITIMIGVSQEKQFLSDLIKAVKKALPQLNNYIPQMSLFVVSLLVGLISSILFFYFCMTIGSLSKNHKIAYGILAIIGISILLSIIQNWFTLLPSVATPLFGFNLMASGSSKVLGNEWNSYLIKTIIFDGVSAIFFFLGTDLIFKKKLNLT